ncbi:ABC transporter ATP-binding protein [Tropicimonas sp. IMCC6043]|uniref:ABC transporter ATP-binding protein n=1 Tax=Tropicimonas sp. IMCC6043 TaxID=2510645 RepID=UPI00101D044E|nr:ABC transporter ATP-binding protein [Tropicimonas sp. IMCC6043]RYH06311.1 ABC transporter ATP-binding protein [Tropicimonas sp. IMCC6043]
MTAAPILDVTNLRVGFRSRRSLVTALRDVSFTLYPGRTLALVGESGSGKSVSSLAIMGLLPKNGAISGGSVRYRRRDGADMELSTTPEAEMRKLRGAEIAMIFQEPMSSLNPLFTIGDQIGEMLLLHSDLDAAARRKRVLEMLELVEIPGAAARMNQYPHEMSGGMRQRVMIALAMVCNPALLIADEPTTALDVTIQAQILDLMRRLQSELGMSILFITHDMGVVAEMADDVAVMYAGAIVEQADARTLFARPTHPYTRGLLNSIPVPGRPAGERLVPIPGTVPGLHAMPPGCAFAPRCQLAAKECERPVALADIASGHRVACIMAEREAAHA